MWFFFAYFTILVSEFRKSFGYFISIVFTVGGHDVGVHLCTVNVTLRVVPAIRKG